MTSFPTGRKSVKYYFYVTQSGKNTDNYLKDLLLTLIILSDISSRIAAMLNRKVSGVSVSRSKGGIYFLINSITLPIFGKLNSSAPVVGLPSVIKTSFCFSL